MKAIYAGPNRLERSDGVWMPVPVDGEWRISEIGFTNRQVQNL